MEIKVSRNSVQEQYISVLTIGRRFFQRSGWYQNIKKEPKIVRTGPCTPMVRRWAIKEISHLFLPSLLALKLLRHQFERPHPQFFACKNRLPSEGRTNRLADQRTHPYIYLYSCMNASKNVCCYVHIIRS